MENCSNKKEGQSNHKISNKQMQRMLTNLKYTVKQFVFSKIHANHARKPITFVVKSSELMQ